MIVQISNLEEKFGSIRNVELRDRGLVFAGATFERLFFLRQGSVKTRWGLNKVTNEVSDGRQTATTRRVRRGQKNIGE